MHTKRAAPRQFRLHLLIDVVYPLRERPKGDLMLLWLLPSFILTLNRDVGLWHFCEVPAGSGIVCLSGLIGNDIRPLPARRCES